MIHVNYRKSVTYLVNKTRAIYSNKFKIIIALVLLNVIILVQNAAFQNFSLGFRPAVYKADSSHYGCPVPKNPLTNQVRFLAHIGH